MSSSKGQFEQGHQPEVQFQSQPGLQKDLGPPPDETHLPDPDGGFIPYIPVGKLKGRKALITGGDSGIGRSTAIMLAREGADIFFTYLPDEKADAEDTKKKIEVNKVNCHMIEADLRSQETCKKVVDEAVKAMGTISILFNNHAYQMVCDTIEELSEEQWLRTFDTNIHAFFYVSKYAIPHMKRGSTIINNASINAYIGRPDLLDYTSTKGAIISFTRGLSNQYISKGLRVNAIAPGPVWTPLIPSTMGEEQIKNFTSPMGRPSQPSEIAACVVFLASQDSAAISGQTIHCNGGTIVNG